MTAALSGGEPIRRQYPGTDKNSPAYWHTQGRMYALPHGLRSVRVDDSAAHLLRGPRACPFGKERVLRRFSLSRPSNCLFRGGTDENRDLSHGVFCILSSLPPFVNTFLSPRPEEYGLPRRGGERRELLRYDSRAEQRSREQGKTILRHHFIEEKAAYWPHSSKPFPGDA